MKLANASNERDSMPPISITRAYEAKLKSRKQKINSNRQFSTPLSFLSTVDSFLRTTTYNQGRVSVIRIPGAGNGNQTDHKRNNYAIQKRKLSQYIARSAGKSNRINFLEGNFPQDDLYLGISSFVYLRTMSSLRLSVLYPK